MTKNYKDNIPGKKIINIGKRIISTLISILETRVQLLRIELENEITKLITLLILINLIMIFASFSFLSLIMLVTLMVNIKYCIFIIAIITSLLLFITLLLGYYMIKKIGQSKLLSFTSKELKKDRELLKD